MKVLAVVVTFNGSRWVENCLRSLSQSVHGAEILVIDNDSHDETVPLISAGFPSVTIIESKENLGFGKANNIGFKKAVAGNFDYVFLLNQDAAVEADTIGQLVSVASANPEYGIISPFHLLLGNKKLEWHFSVFISPEKCPDLLSDIYYNSTKDIYPLPFVNAAAWLISRDCFLKVGGFDPLFPHYGEDEDYCNRALYHGFKIGVTPRSKIFHDITMKSWDEIKFSFQRQLIFSFIELKQLNFTYRYLLFTYIKTRLERLSTLLFTRRWKELSFFSKVFFRSFSYFGKIRRSRKEAKTNFSYLK